MIRLGHVGVPFTWTLPAPTFLLLAAVLALIWRRDPEAAKAEAI
jgi:hypothetical protein